MRRLLIWLILILALGAAATIVTVSLVVKHAAEPGGQTTVEQWLAQQLQRIAGAYLNPRCTLGELDYQAPQTVVLRHVRLTADDPANPGQSIQVLSVDEMTLVLGRVPRVGEPIVIERLTLDHPVVRIVATGSDESPFIGWSNLLKPTATDPAARQPSDPKLSDVFRIRLIELIAGNIVYDTRQQDAEPMVLDDINTKLTVSPSDGAWYTIKTHLQRQPVFSMDVDGRFNLDEFMLDLSDLQARVDLDQSGASSLPPQIQKLINDYKVTGQLALKAKGTLPIATWQDAKLQASLSLIKGNVTVGAYRLPVDSLSADLTVMNRQANLGRVAADLLGGSVLVSGGVDVDKPYRAWATLSARKLRIQDALSAASADPKPKTPPKYAGALSGEVSWAGPLTDAATMSKGKGLLHLTEGRISQLPIVSALGQAMNVTLEKVASGITTFQDSGHVEFDIVGDHLDMKAINAETPVIALRGNGTIRFDRTVDLRFNGGPLEKVQSLLGRVGELFGNLTDQLAKYTVTGTLAEPKVNAQLGNGK